MLSITEEFYYINNTSANYKKYVLATNAISTVQDLAAITFDLTTSLLNNVRSILSLCLRLFVVYLHNTVLISKLDYRMQVMHLFEAKCSVATSSVRSLVKHKAKLSRFTPNAILYLSQALDYIASTIALLMITPFRLLRAGFASMPDMTYSHGHTPIYQCFSSEVFKTNLMRLRKCGLFYLFQLLTLQGTHLIFWSVIYSHSVQKLGNARISKWYKDLSANVTSPNCPILLLDQYMTTLPSSLAAKELTLCTPLVSHKKNWIVTLDTDDHLLFSKQLQFQPVHSTCIIVHWISNCISCPSDLITLKPYSSCFLDINKSSYLKKSVTTNSVAYSCTIPLLQSMILPIQKTSIMKYTTQIASTVSWAEIMTSYFYRFNISSDYSTTDPSALLLMTDLDSSATSLFTADDIVTSTPIILSSDSHYMFYTDRSLINLGLSDVSMAEAAVLYTALSTTPVNSVVHLYTDSQTAINDLKQCSLLTYSNSRLQSPLQFADSLANTAYVSNESVLISRLDLAAVHDFILVYNGIVFDWALTWHSLLFQHKFDDFFTLTNASKHYTLKFQLFLKDLPILESLKRTRPDLYIEILTCRSCEDQLEDFIYLFICKKRRCKMQSILNSYMHHLLVKIKEASINANRDYSCQVDRITSLPCWMFYSTSWPPYAFVRGCLSTAFIITILLR
ncbi:hypothetical protein RhiirC2_857096 [Rhizophagus irregularis]|uniref:RNase H type-1 domain-containing protein n=1 Tax=Rhizophagus irregularis TaxID=588596 RepID=A0A2N1ME75_9GLOM|nr:hypothetical protein RhiirC2_857096 [Rhizophagus irregularis]